MTLDILSAGKQGIFLKIVSKKNLDLKSDPTYEKYVNVEKYMAVLLSHYNSIFFHLSAKL